MTYESQIITAHLKEVPTGVKIESLFELLFQEGFTTKERDAGRRDEASDNDSVSEVVESISTGESASLTLLYPADNLDDPIEVRLLFLQEEPTPFVVSMMVNAYHLESRKDRNPVEQVSIRSRALVQFGRFLYDALDPLHVESRRSFDVIDMRTETPFPSLLVDGVVIECPLDWYAIFNPEIIERIGTDWLNGTTVHRRERLESDALLVVLTERPDETKKLDEIQDRLANAISNPEVWSKGK